MILQDENLVENAYLLGMRLHKGQFRADKKTPYFEHPKEVRSIFLEKYHGSYYRILGARDEYRGQAIALLHDAVEDTNITFEELAKLGYGDIIHELKLLTKFEGGSYLDYLLKLKHSGNALALFVKLADMEANLKDLENFPNEKTRKSLKMKYEMAKYILTHS